MPMISLQTLGYRKIHSFVPLNMRRSLSIDTQSTTLLLFISSERVAGRERGDGGETQSGLSSSGRVLTLILARRLLSLVSRFRSILTKNTLPLAHLSLLSLLFTTGTGCSLDTRDGWFNSLLTTRTPTSSNDCVTSSAVGLHSSSCQMRM